MYNRQHMDASPQPIQTACRTKSIVGLIVGVLLMLLIDKGVHQWNAHECREETPFINSDIACGKQIVLKKHAYTNLRNDLYAFIEAQQEKGSLIHLSIYFRDLEDGPVFGIGELDPFAPTGALKLPLAMALFDIAAEQEAPLLDERIRVGNTEELMTVSTLMFYMLTYDDDASFDVLNAYVQTKPGLKERVQQSFQSVGLIDPRQPEEPILTVRGYASLVRMLYHASYVSMRDSNLLLEWLAASPDKNGIARGVPKEIEVAHRFGRRAAEQNKGQRLHDCGIVYYPDNPYLLCVVVETNEESVAMYVLKTVSEMVYKEVNSRRL